jgi:DNA-binding transcriptional MerR regulator
VAQRDDSGSAPGSGGGSAGPGGGGPSPELPRQEALFPIESSVADELIGYRGPTACAAAGITYRQLDYWARTGLVEPSVRSAAGSGTQRLYSFQDILVLKVVKRLLDTGVSLQNIRVAVGHLRARGVADLAQVTLLSDGTTVYECTSPEEIVDLLAGGQGVFGIAVSGALRELSGTLAELPGERAEHLTDTPTEPDELSERRRRRTAAG